jgi:hypothetical protein
MKLYGTRSKQELKKLLVANGSAVYGFNENWLKLILTIWHE